MLTLQGFFPQGCRTVCEGLRTWRLPAALLAALACASPSSAQQGQMFPQDSPIYAQGAPIQYGPAVQYGPSGQMSPTFQLPLAQPARSQPFGAIQQVQNTPQSARAMHRLIESLPQAQDDIEVIERRHQLMVMRTNISRISIGDQTIVDIVQYSPKEMALVGLARGTTSLTFWFENEADPVIYTVKTVRDPNADNQRKLDYGRLERKIALLYPNSKVYLIPTQQKIIVRGQVRDSEEAAHILNIIRGEVINQDGSLFGPQPYWNGANSGGNAVGISGGGGAGVGLGAWDLAAGMILNELRVPGEFQIAMRIRIAELNRSQADRAGVDLNVLINNGAVTLGTTLGAAAGSLRGTFDNGNVGVFLDYLSSNGIAKILSEPQMTVLSGQQAQFLSGGEYAVPTTIGIGGGQTTFFRGFGTQVLATPTVTDRDLIRLSITAEYSDLGAIGAGGVAGTSNRRIATTVELREGQTMAMAGLLSHRTKTEVQRIPVLGDIPKIGPLLFSSKTSTQEENELLILVTPEIVRPMDADQVSQVPGFEVTRPTYDQFYKLNMTEGPPDTGYYHLPPFGSGSVGTNVDYQHFNPGPAASMYSPVPTNPNGPGPARGPGMVSPMSSAPTQQSPNRLYPVPQASSGGARPTGSQYSNQVLTPGNNSGVRQMRWNQPATPQRSQSPQGQRR